jgi:hypothetical protein
MRLGTAVLFVLLLSVSGDVFGDDYWQQEINYHLDIVLDHDLRTVSGEIQIEYINNSPDTLNRIYLKAFPNAIQKGSYADLKRRRLNDYSFAALKRQNRGSLEIYALDDDRLPTRLNRFVGQGISIDNTIITVHLDDPIQPHDTAWLSFGFTTVLPKPASMRMGVEGGVIKAAYWYPQVCVYDRKLGWVNGQYLGWGECYGDFGRFDVTITAPEDQIVAATGVCVNETEVLPDSLRQKLDLGNFLNPRSQWPEFSYDTAETKTWHYVAENVNDFVFTSSSHFCIDTGSVNGVQVVAYALRGNAERWVDAVGISKEAIETFSELYLPYQWPVIRICDAYSGMEYPMLTNCRHWGSTNGFHLLLYHEIGHQWFMGQIGLNQVDRPFLDEGFTTHAEHNAMEKYLGREGNMDYFTNWYQRCFSPHFEDRYVRCFYPLLMLMKRDYDKPMVFSYDQAEEYWPYRVSAYYKSAAMNYSLRSIFGDSLYYRAMQQFCRKWLFKHPYEDDFRESMEEATGVKLTEYLNQWYYSRRRLDYAFRRKSTKLIGNTYHHTIQLERKGSFVSPIDVAVVYPQGDTTFYTVPPEGMDYAKPNHILLPTWHQFRRNDDSYEFIIRAQRDVEKVVVDPHQLLMDINRLNNEPKKLLVIPPVELRLDNLKYDRTPLDKYALRLRPDLWYDEPNGVQVGLHTHGSFLEEDNKLNIDARLGTESLRPVIDATYSNPFSPFGFNSELSNRFLRADRRMLMATAYEKHFQKLYSRPDHALFRLELDYVSLSGTQDSLSAPLPGEVVEYLPALNWSAGHTYYFKLVTGWLKTFRYGRYFFATTAMIGDYEDAGLHRAFGESRYQVGLRLSVPFKTQVDLDFEFLDIAGDPPAHFLFHLSRVPAVDRFVGSPLFRSPGTFPVAWEDDFYLADTRVRGYQDRPVYITGSRAASLSLTPPDLLPYKWLRTLPLIGGFLSRVNQSFFIDGAAVTMDGKEKRYADPIADSETAAKGDAWSYYASAGVSIKFPAVWSGQRFRLDFPFYLSKPGPGEDELDFRFSVAWQLTGVFD